MLEIEGRTIGQAFEAAVERYAGRPLLMVPRNASRAYDANGRTITYDDAALAVSSYAAMLRSAGYGHGHRIAVLLENRPEMLLFKVACNQLGISWVPVNPDYRSGAIAYLVNDAAVDMAVCADVRKDQMAAGILESGRNVPTHVLAEGSSLPRAGRPAPLDDDVHPSSEASLLYTSGTTGRPKGCILSHEYELELGRWYGTRGGYAALNSEGDRVYCPLPLFHVNAGIVLFYGMILSGNCQVIPDRFSRTNWWREVRETEATGVHYLGVIIPVLMNEPPSPDDRNHKIRWGFGAGVEPSLHAAFEERFGFPLVEVWGMTEMCRVLANCHEPRFVDTRAMGRPQPGLEVRVVDEDDCDVALGEAGELIVRHSKETPRKGAFSGYLNQPEATEEAWRGGWFHTGDTVRQDDSGMLYFVDRKKNIIRRSGENIAAAEVEACLQAHPNVAQVAVIAIEDQMRDEEVMACVVARDAAGDAQLARKLFDCSFANLEYYKAPGWVVFVDELPVTGTQKILKHMIFREGEDPRALPGAHDLREFKKR